MRELKNLKALNKIYDNIRPLKFWGKPTLCLVSTECEYLGKGNTLTNTIKDALFNLKRGVGTSEYEHCRYWLKEMLIAYENIDTHRCFVFFEPYEAEE